MRIIVAPDSFKECLSAEEASEAVAAGVRDAAPDAAIDCIPMADGGEGTVAAIVAATGGTLLTARVDDPLGRPIPARYGVTGDGETAVIEMAAASGLALLRPADRRPLVTSTTGTGQLIGAALDQGARRIVVGIGGSATVDGGAGMAEALGARLLDRKGRALARGGAALAALDHIDLSGLDPRLASARIRVACDVTNPLLGPTGAARVYAPQKGASREDVETLEAALARLADVIERDLGVDVRTLPGAGAAGGLGAGLRAFLGAALEPGVGIVLDVVRFRQRARGADLVITGEGCIDGQTVFGKTPIGVARAAAECGVPAIALAGRLGPGWDETVAAGLAAVFSIAEGPCSLAEALASARDRLRETAAQVVRVWTAGRAAGAGYNSGGDPAVTRQTSEG